MERLTTNRTYWLTLVLCFVPIVGWIYVIWFYHDAIKSFNIACGHVEKEVYEENKSPGTVVFLIFSLITGGIYQLYWIWKQGKRMTEAGERYGIRNQFKDPERKKFTVIVICQVIIWILAFVINYNKQLYLEYLMSWARYSMLNSIISLANLICLFFIGSAYNTFFKDLNLLCGAYNSQVIDGNEPPNAASKTPTGIEDKIEDKQKYEQKDDQIALTDLQQEGGDNGRLEQADSQSKPGAIRMISGEYAGAEIRLAYGEKIVIGRDPNKCSLVCSSERVSREHLEIGCIEAGNGKRVYTVKDLSSNGTYSSESGVLPPKKLVFQNVGTVLELGKSDESIRLL